MQRTDILNSQWLFSLFDDDDDDDDDDAAEERSRRVSEKVFTVCLYYA